jgi:hypothetical protein
MKTAMLSSPRRALVKRIVARKRREHTELRGSLTFDSVLTIAEREGIPLSRSKMSDGRHGLTIRFLGTTGIVLNERLVGRELLEVALHELGHVHMNHLDDPAQLARALRGGDDDDTRLEAEADLYTELLLGEKLTHPTFVARAGIAAGSGGDL